MKNTNVLFKKNQRIPNFKTNFSHFVSLTISLYFPAYIVCVYMCTCFFARNVNIYACITCIYNFMCSCVTVSTQISIIHISVYISVYVFAYVHECFRVYAYIFVATCFIHIFS